MKLIKELLSEENLNEAIKRVKANGKKITLCIPRVIDRVIQLYLLN